MRDHSLACIFLLNADHKRYGQLRVELANEFALGHNKYPISLTAAYQILLTYKKENSPDNGFSMRKGEPRRPRCFRPPRVGGPTPGSEQTPNADTGRGFPGRGRFGHNFSQVGFCLTQVHHPVPPPHSYSLAQINDQFLNGIPDHYILLDSDSTISIFCNPHMLTDIHDVDVPLCLETNGGGYQLTYQMGTVTDFGKVWFNPESLANILSLVQVRWVRCVTMDTQAEAAFHVHNSDPVFTSTTLYKICRILLPILAPPSTPTPTFKQ
jgi:hypothetical protein